MTLEWQEFLGYDIKNPGNKKIDKLNTIESEMATQKNGRKMQVMYLIGD